MSGMTCLAIHSVKVLSSSLLLPGLLKLPLFILTVLAPVRCQIGSIDPRDARQCFGGFCSGAKKVAGHHFHGCLKVSQVGSFMNLGELQLVDVALLKVSLERMIVLRHG